MFFRLLIVFLSLVVCPMGFALEWKSDYTRVLDLSKQQNKPVLLFFNGSDWSGLAMKMKHEVLDTLAFQERIQDQFICMEADFPIHTTLHQELALQNNELKKRFNVSDLPLLLVLDADERVIAQMGYFPEGGQQLAEDLLRVVEQDDRLTFGLKNLNAPSTQLKELYELARELGRTSAMEEILETGLSTQEPYFFLEKYRLLVEKGEVGSEEAQTLRQKLATLDPENKQEVHFTLALIDFQELAQKNLAPSATVQPLIEYLSQWRVSDQKNVWRIEMMIAQIYMESDLKEEALKYAERALHSAPESMHEEIAHSLDYIRSSTTQR